MIILFFGLPGSGKTTLCKELLKHTPAIHLNADEVRGDLSSDLGFSIEDRVEQARRLGAIARLLSAQGHVVLVDFVNPTLATREAFGKSDIAVWINRINESRFADTNLLWEDPDNVDIQIISGMDLASEVTVVMSAARLHDWKKPTTLMLGRYQPWHEGHDALYEVGLEKTGQVLIAVRDTQGTSEKDPLSHAEVVNYIKDYRQNALTMRVPNITNIIYGRDVGYQIEKIELSPELQSISATQKRKEIGL
jgi:adenylate kinase family enzyme